MKTAAASAITSVTFLSIVWRSTFVVKSREVSPRRQRVFHRFVHGPYGRSASSTRDQVFTRCFAPSSVQLFLGFLLRVAYATASTVQFVSGMSYMAALMLVREPVESVAYATLVTLLQV